MTPLVQGIRDVLHGDGPMRPEQVRRALRARGSAPPLEQVNRLLREHADLFRPAGTDAWDLAERWTGPTESVPKGPAVDPLLGTTFHDRFVTIDVETTGTDPERDEIVQVAAVRFESGQPTEAFHRHVSPTSASVSAALRVRMGWTEVPADLPIQPRTAMDELGAFVGGDVAMAWNASFDLEFLSRAGWTADRIVDALAVTLIAQPSGPQRLAEQAQTLLGDFPTWPPHVPVQGHPRAADRPHDALFDCLLTGLTYAEAVARLQAGVGPQVAALLAPLPAGTAQPAVQSRPQPAGLPTTDAATLLGASVRALGHEVRDGQLAVTRTAAAAIDGRPALVEAPTGTGKTLGYLAAAMAAATAGHRIALVTAYKNLQDQLLAEFDELTRELGAGVSLAVLKGAANYLCRYRLDRVVRSLDDTDAEGRFVCAVLHRLVDLDVTSTREDVSGWLLHRFPRARGLLDEVAVGCTHPGCGRRIALSRANNAQIVVLNQVLWVEPPQGLNPCARVVIDEAHDLESMATLALTEEVGSLDLMAIANRLVRSDGGGVLPAVNRAGTPADGAIELTNRLRVAAEQARGPLLEFARALVGDVSDEFGGQVRLRRAPATLHAASWSAAGDSVRFLHDTLRHLADHLLALRGAVRDTELIEELDVVEEAVREADESLRVLLAVRDHSSVYFLEIGPARGWRIARAPVDVAPLLKDRWDALDGFLLISATLQSGAGDFSFIANQLGLPASVSAHVVDSDLPFDENVVFGISRWLDAIPTPRFMPEFQRDTANELTTLARLGRGRLLALFTATRRVTHAAEAIREPLAHHAIPVLAQGEGARTALLEGFRTRHETVLLGTRSFWQGVDVPGPSLSFVVIEKLPFPHLRDPITEARLERVRRSGRNEFESYLLPLATIAFKQGFGRLIRGRNDRGLVLLLDRRFHTKAYQHQVLGALPGFRPRDTEAEQSQRRFYRHVADTLPDLFDDDALQEIDTLPDRSTPTDVRYVVPRQGERETRRPAVMAALEGLFGFPAFRSNEQEELFWRIHDGENVIGILPTGAGKSLPFQLAALVGEGLTVVVSPLVALMRDQVEQLINRGIRDAAALVGAMAADERDEVLRLATEGRIRLLYVSPERLRDPVFLSALERMPLDRVVVDEAHCVSLWGPSFRPDFLAIRPALDAAGHDEIPVAALTATATPDIERDMRANLRITGAHKVASELGRPGLRFAVMSPRSAVAADIIRNDKDRMRALLRILIAAERRGECALVYVPTVARAEEITGQLTHVGLIARAYHGRLDPWQRENVEGLFRDGELDVVVATKAFGMGIDRPDVRYVIHYGYPSDLESYYQEAGRAGRDGEPSWCVLLTLDRDRNTQEWFIDQVSKMDDLLQSASRALSARGIGPVLVDLEALADELGVDETASRVLIYYLETAGLLRRDTDQTVMANVLRLDDALPTALQDILGNVPLRMGTPIDLEAVADASGRAIRDVEQLLLAEARTGRIVFRPFKRKASVTISAPTSPATATPSTRPIVAELTRKLDEMQAYAEGRVAGGCRPVALRRYLGDPDPQPCGCCDVCDPHYERPWLGVTLDSIPRPDLLIDPESVALAAVDWNAREASQGRSPYGRTALAQILAGDRFSLGRYTAGRDRERRIRRAQASPYWGAMQLMTNPARQVDSAFTRLRAEGLIEPKDHTPATVRSDGPAGYTYDKPTAAGRRVLEGALTTR